MILLRKQVVNLIVQALKVLLRRLQVLCSLQHPIESNSVTYRAVKVQQICLLLCVGNFVFGAQKIQLIDIHWHSINPYKKGIIA